MDSRHKLNLHAYLTIICTVSVGGPTAMAYGFAQGGWMSFLLIGLTGMVAWYTGLLLIECVYVQPKERLDSYAAIGRAAFGQAGWVVIHFFHKLILLSVSALFIKLSGINPHQVFRHLEFREEIFVITAGLIIMVPYVASRNMKELLAISLLGLFVALLTAGLGSTLAVLDMKPVSHAVFNWRDAPAALGTFGFAFGGNVIFTHVEESLPKKEDWSKVLGMAMGTVSILYMITGSLGYLAYGSQVANPVMGSLPPNLATSILDMFVTAHLLLATPFFLITFNIECEPETLAFPYRALVRILVIATLTSVAALVNHFGAYVSLVGAISNLVVVFITPVILNLKLFGWRGRSCFTYLTMSVCILMGLFGGILGIVGAFNDIISKFTSAPAN